MKKQRVSRTGFISNKTQHMHGVLVQYAATRAFGSRGCIVCILDGIMHRDAGMSVQ